MEQNNLSLGFHLQLKRFFPGLTRHLLSLAGHQRHLRLLLFLFQLAQVGPAASTCQTRDQTSKGFATLYPLKR